MSETDVLARAAAALRAAHDGQREGSGFTRARILDALGSRRRARPWRWLVAAPLASLLLVGSAWAQSTGNWGRVWQTVASVLTRVKPGENLPVQRPPTEKPLSAALPPVPAPSLPPEAVPPKAVSPDAIPAEAVSPEVAPPHAKRPPAKPASSEGERAPNGAADPEFAAFRSAHELHVRGETRAAVAAYAGYLSAYPHGRFVPEARYNRALDWIKLGETTAARTALTHFADGEYAGYRQREARELLEALPP